MKGDHSNNSQELSMEDFNEYGGLFNFKVYNNFVDINVYFQKNDLNLLSLLFLS